VDEFQYFLTPKQLHAFLKPVESRMTFFTRWVLGYLLSGVKWLGHEADKLYLVLR